LRTILVLLSVVLMMLAPPLQTNLRAGENEDFRFAMKLRTDRMHVAAAEEFLRFAENYPRSALRPRAIFHAGEEYMQAGKARGALDAFELYLDAYPDQERACEARFQRGRIFQALRRYREAADELLAVPESYPDCRLAGRAMLEAGENLISVGDFGAAAGVLRRLTAGESNDELKPRAMYSLAIALENIGRDLEAESILGELVSLYPSSPVAALSLMRLGDRALERGDTEAALGYYGDVNRRFKEKSLQERATLRKIEIFADSGKDRPLLDESGRFLKEFEDSSNRGIVYRESINAAWRLGEMDRALSLIEGAGEEQAVNDTTGELLLLKGKILAEKGRNDHALGELALFRRSYPESPFMADALAVEAGLRRVSGEHREAARLYQHALLEGASGKVRLEILSSLATISFEDLGDTLTALQYWDMITAGDPRGERGEAALWKSSLAREKIGDYEGAQTGYEELASTFYGTAYAEQAAERLEALAIRIRWDEETVRMLARTASSTDPPSYRSLSAGVILLDGAGDAGAAIVYLEEALRQELPDSLRAKGTYYLGLSHFRLYQLSLADGRDDGEERKEALSLWLEGAREYTGTWWGQHSHRSYVEHRLSDWKISEGLARLDEYLRLYGGGSGRWWALGEKVDLLYRLAQEGHAWAADSALAVSSELLAGNATRAEKREALLKTGYLARMNGMNERAAAAFAEFVSVYQDDPRSLPVLYDMGETLLALKRYREALDAYAACIELRPLHSLGKKCRLRTGDCNYYLHEFGEAARIYGDFSESYPDDPLAYEALYRRALSLEMMGRGAETNEILGGLLAANGVARSLEAKVRRKLGARMLHEKDYVRARALLAELGEDERSAETLTLLAEAELGSGMHRDAAKSFSSAIKYEGADTCRILAGRARAGFREGKPKDGNRDLERLRERCPGDARAAAVLLDKGISEVEGGSCAEAEQTLGGIRERFAGTAEAAQALYYLALCDIKRGGYEEAISRLETYLREAPDSEMIGQVYFKLASANYAAGNLNLAARNYALAAEVSSDRDFAFMAMRNEARIYQELEDWEKAAATWQKIVDLYPEMEGIVEVLFDLGFSYSQYGRFDMAYEVYRRIPGLAASEEQQGRAHYWAGIALKNRGDYAEAIREFLRVPYLRTGGMWGVTAKLEAAGCYRQLGNTEEAIKIYEDVVSSHGPDSDWGKVAVGALEQLRSSEAEGGSGESKDSDGGSDGRNIIDGS
jgi:TolA-binding protein